MKQLWSGRRPVMLWVRKNSGSVEDAEDLLQEAIIVCIKMMDKPGFKLVAKPETLLFAVAKNMWFFQLRKNKRMPMADMQEHIWMEGMAAMETMLEKEEQIRLMEQALLALGEKCRLLLEMFYFLKLDMKTIAEKLHFRNDKVTKAMKYKCLEQARQLIKKETK